MFDICVCLYSFLCYSLAFICFSVILFVFSCCPIKKLTLLSFDLFFLLVVGCVGCKVGGFEGVCHGYDVG